MIELHGVGASTEERFSGLEPENELEGIDALTYGVVFLLELFVFPHDHDAVALGEQSVFLVLGGLVDVTHHLVTHFVTGLVTVQETPWAPVPKATVKFVHGVSAFVIAVHVKGLVSGRITCSPLLREWPMSRSGLRFK